MVVVFQDDAKSAIAIVSTIVFLANMAWGCFWANWAVIDPTGPAAIFSSVGCGSILVFMANGLLW